MEICGFIFYDLRRTFITDMRDAGVGRAVIMSVTGHADRDMHDRYNPVDDGDKLETIKELEAYREKIRQTLDKIPTTIKKPLTNKGLGSQKWRKCMGIEPL
jgi:hypothetical protein